MAADPRSDLARRLRTGLNPILRVLGLQLEVEQVQALTAHLDLLLRWNTKINLTSLRDIDEIVRRHFGESLFVAKISNIGSGTLVDIGSGPGFPGFPIAVVHAGVRLTLVESVAKKAAFLRELARNNPNVRVFHGRFEDLQLCFEWGVVRGVAWNSIRKLVSTKVQNIALLLGQAEQERISSERSFLWHEPVPVPWEPTRVLLVGSKGLMVSRGT